MINTRTAKVFHELSGKWSPKFEEGGYDEFTAAKSQYKDSESQ
ncbi:hypothetical protein [Chryseobacterium bernardetii]